MRPCTVVVKVKEAYDFLPDDDASNEKRRLFCVIYLTEPIEGLNGEVTGEMIVDNPIATSVGVYSAEKKRYIWNQTVNFFVTDYKDHQRLKLRLYDADCNNEIIGQWTGRSIGSLLLRRSQSVTCPLNNSIDKDSAAAEAAAAAATRTTTVDTILKNILGDSGTNQQSADLLDWDSEQQPTTESDTDSNNEGKQQSPKEAEEASTSANTKYGSGVLTLDIVCQSLYAANDGRVRDKYGFVVEEGVVTAFMMSQMTAPAARGVPLVITPYKPPSKQPTTAADAAKADDLDWLLQPDSTASTNTSQNEDFVLIGSSSSEKKIQSSDSLLDMDDSSFASSSEQQQQQLQIDLFQPEAAYMASNPVEDLINSGISPKSPVTKTEAVMLAPSAVRNYVMPTRTRIRELAVQYGFGYGGYNPTLPQAPHAGHRGQLWQECAEVSERVKLRSYHDLIATMRIDPEVSQQITMDIGRTFPDHPLFLDERQLASLKNVLLAYASVNPHVGYCQSMNFIVGFLLLFMDEEAAFWVLSYIIEMVPEYYTENMLGLRVDQMIIDEMVGYYIPDLKAHFDYHGIQPSFVTCKWLLCLFVSILPTETTLRMWDLILSHGNDTILQVCIGILRIYENEIRATDNAPDIYHVMKSLPESLFDENKLIEASLSIDVKDFVAKRIEYEKVVLEEIRSQDIRRSTYAANNSNTYTLAGHTPSKQKSFFDSLPRNINMSNIRNLIDIDADSIDKRLQQLDDRFGDLTNAVEKGWSAMSSFMRRKFETINVSATPPASSSSATPSPQRQVVSRRTPSAGNTTTHQQ